MELNAAVFGIEPNMTVVHAAVKNYLANQRQGTQSTLTRAEVRGGGFCEEICGRAGNGRVHREKPEKFSALLQMKGTENIMEAARTHSRP